MHEYAVFLPGLDAFILDFDGHSAGSPVLNMGSTFLDGSTLMNELLSEEALGPKGRSALGDRTSDYVNGHLRRPSQHSLTSIPQRNIHAPSARAASHQRPLPLLVMKPLPPIPTVASPILPEFCLSSYTPESSAPDLSWGMSEATPSLPPSPATLGHGTLHASQVSPDGPESSVFALPRCPATPTPVSPMSEFDTAEVLRIYDQLQPTPEPSPGPTTRRNHPYIPWPESVRQHILAPAAARSELMLGTAATERPSRPPSRSGAMAPEPLEDYMEPGCWAKTARWAQLAGSATRSMKRLLRSRKHRTHRARTAPHEDIPAVPPSPESIVYALEPPVTIPPRLRTRTSFRTPPTPSPREIQSTLPLTTCRTPTDSACAPSRNIPSFASAGTSTLHEWLAAQWRASLEGGQAPHEHMTLDEYERCGSWLGVVLDDFADDDETEEDEDAQMAREERRRRADAMRQGYACGFVGCAMHDQTHSLSSPPRPTNSRHPTNLSPSRHTLDPDHSISGFHHPQARQ